MATQRAFDNEQSIRQVAIEPSTEQALRECVDFYRREMGKILPEMNDESLFHVHLENKRKAMEYFLGRTAGLLTQDYSLALINDAIEKAFLEVVNTNWSKCESLCQEVLTNLKFAVITSLPNLKSKNAECQSQWWSRIKNLRKKYSDSIGDSLFNLMPHVWLRYLNERQTQDYEVIMGDIDLEREKVDELNDVDTSSLNDSFDGDVAYQPLPTEADTKPSDNVYTDFSSETVDKQLRLQMTWGRIFVFWKYWIDCRKDSTDLLQKLVDVVERCEQSSGEEVAAVSATPHTRMSYQETMRNVFRRFQQDVTCKNIPLDFARALSKDFLAYDCLIRKLQDFFDMVLSPDYVCAFDMNPTGIFQLISNFQSDMTEKPSRSRECSGFRACADFLEREQDQSNVIARMFGKDSKPLFHLRTLFQRLAATPGDPLSVAVRKFSLELIEEERNWSSMLAESIDALLTVAANVTEAIPQLRRDIIEWSPRRDETIAQLRPIIAKLNETTKNVAITQTVSSSVGIVGGAIAIGGLILAPFTFGASLVPSAIAGGVVSGIAAGTAIGAAVSEIVIDKGQMEKAMNCLQQDKVLFDGVANQIKYMNLNSTLLLRYIPQDELETFISVITDPKSTAMQSVATAPQLNPRIALNIARLLSVGGRTLVMPVSRMVIAGTIAASRVAVLALAHGIAAVGVALDIANLVVAGVKLGKGAKSQNAEKLEDVIVRLEEEKQIVDNCLNDIDLDF